MQDPFSEAYLTLEDIDADQDLVPLLRSWEGISGLKCCPDFNDTLLHMMVLGRGPIISLEESTDVVRDPHTAVIGLLPCAVAADARSATSSGLSKRPFDVGHRDQREYCN